MTVYFDCSLAVHAGGRRTLKEVKHKLASKFTGKQCEGNGKLSLSNNTVFFGTFLSELRGCGNTHTFAGVCCSALLQQFKFKSVPVRSL